MYCALKFCIFVSDRLWMSCKHCSAQHLSPHHCLLFFSARYVFDDHLFLCLFEFIFYVYIYCWICFLHHHFLHSTLLVLVCKMVGSAEVKRKDLASLFLNVLSFSMFCVTMICFWWRGLETAESLLHKIEESLSNSLFLLSSVGLQQKLYNVLGFVY